MVFLSRLRAVVRPPMGSWMQAALLLLALAGGLLGGYTATRLMADGEMVRNVDFRSPQ